jgi:hypothetical protein
LRKPVPVLALGGCFSFACVCLAIAGYKAWDRFHQMQRRATASDPIRACLEESLDWWRHEIRLWKQVLWWLFLPLAIGQLVLFVSFSWAVGGLEAIWTIPELAQVFVFFVFETIGLLWGGTWFIRWYVRRYYEPRQRELESLLQDLQSD